MLNVQSVKFLKSNALFWQNDLIKVGQFNLSSENWGNRISH